MRMTTRTVTREEFFKMMNGAVVRTNGTALNFYEPDGIVLTGWINDEGRYFVREEE